MKLFFPILIFYLLFSCGVKPIQLSPTRELKTKIKEPSGIAYDKENNQYFVVSDNGKLIQLDSEFKKVRKAPFKGKDFEAVCVKGNLIYVSDESARKVYVFEKKSLNLLQTITLNIEGRKNKGIESIAYNPFANQFILANEKAPISIMIFDKDFILQKEYEYSESSDVSDITYHNNHYYVLSDEERLIIKMDATFKALTSWEIPVKNPEGICFKDETLIITSDKHQKIFFFNLDKK